MARKIPLTEPDLSGNEAKYLQDCIETGFVSSIGAYVSNLEAAVRDATGAADAVAVSSGTSGLHVALVALGVGPGDLVIAPSLTFIASANAISHAGATPWLADVDEGSLTLNTHGLEAMLASETEQRDGQCVHVPTGRRVAAVMPVHLFGLPADMDAICAIAKRHGIKILADAAAALHATYKGRPLAEMGADLSVLSFNGNKTVTSGAGGAVFGQDQTLLDHVRHLSTTARVGADYDHDEVGFNFRMSNIQAAVGVAQMERAADLVAAKRRIAQTYRDALNNCPGIEPLPRPDGTDSACWLSGILLSPNAKMTATELRTELNDLGIDARPAWRPVHLQKPYQDAPRADVSVCERVWNQILTLPCSATLSTQDQAYVIDAVQRLLGNDRAEEA